MFQGGKTGSANNAFLIKNYDNEKTKIKLKKNYREASIFISKRVYAIIFFRNNSIYLLVK
jgi:hypothetical protein